MYIPMRKIIILSALSLALLSACNKLASDAPSGNTDVVGQIFRVSVSSNSKIHVLITEVHSDSVTRDTTDITTVNPKFSYGFKPAAGSVVGVSVKSEPGTQFGCTIYYKGNKIGPASISNPSSGAQVNFSNYKIVN